MIASIRRLPLSLWMVLIGSLALALLVCERAVQAQSTPARGGEPQQPASLASHTLYLPLLEHNYSAPQNHPFGIVMAHAVDRASGLDHMQAAGARWVVTVLDWESIEPAEGQFEWAEFDARVANAQAAGMQVYVLFAGDPAWAWLPDRSATVPEKRLNTVRILAERYDCDGVEDAPGNLCIQYWSFYAEPDAHNRFGPVPPGYKGYWGHRGAEYADMIAGVADAMHAQNPNAKVLIGGLAFDWFEEQGGPFVRSFLGDVLARLNAAHGGAANYLDAIAFHYYPLQFPTIRAKAEAIRAILRASGVDQLPLIVPEIAYWSATSAYSSEVAQARRLVQMYVQGLAIGIERLAWYEVFDRGPGTEEHGLFWGQDLGRPKLAYRAYGTLTHELGGARYLRPLAQEGVEGYVFGTPSGTEKAVVWALSSGRTVRFPYRCLRRVELNGTVVAPINDGDQAWDHDGQVNGQIALGVAQDTPIYVEPCPAN